MGTLLKFLLLALAVVWLFHSPALRGQVRKRGSSADRAEPPQPPSPAPPPAPAPMVACAHCGVHLPVAEAVPDPDGRLYCTQAHQRAAR